MNLKFMKIAFLEAKKAFLENEIPIGAVLVKNNRILAKAHNEKEKRKNVIAHAEILVIQKANKILNNWRLLDCELYVTLKPCKMCMDAINQSRISKLFYVLENNSFCKSVDIAKINNNIIENKIKKVIFDFFEKKRRC